MTITTERLFIEPLSEKDSSFIFKLLNTDDWIKYIGNRNINSEADAVAYIQKIKNNPDVTYWTASLKDTKDTIGLVTLIKRDYLEHKDIGFAFLPAFSKQGYAYEATRAVLMSLVENKSIETIHAITLPENQSSIKLLEKLDLTFDKTIEQNNERLHLYSGSYPR